MKRIFGWAISGIVAFAATANAGTLVVATPEKTYVAAKVGDLIEIRIPYKPAEDEKLKDLKAKIDGKAIRQVAIADNPTLKDGRPIDQSNMSFFAIADAAGKVTVTVTPVGADGKAKPEIRFAIAIDESDEQPVRKFKAVLQQSNAGLPRGTQYGDFTLKGPIEDTLVPLPNDVGEVVSDSTGKLLFGMGGHGLYQLDLDKKKATQIVATDVPEISWSMGLSYDTKRERVLLATLGGEGFIYSYDHKNDKWSVVGSLKQVDVTAIAYIESLDRIFAIAAGPFGDRKPKTVLYEYDAETGRLIQDRPIDLPIVGSFIDRALQLIPVDGSLVFVQMPETDRRGDRFDPLPKRADTPLIHIIDPKTGKVKKAEE